MNPCITWFARVVHTTSDLSNRWVEGLLCVIGLGVALLMGAQVFFRYALNHSLFWSEEVGRICLVWITFLGGSAAFKRRAHLGIDFLVNRFPASLRWMTQVAVLLASLCFFGALIFYGAAFMAFIASQRTPALGMSMAVPYAAIPLSGLLFFLHGSSQLLELFGEASSSP